MSGATSIDTMSDCYVTSQTPSEGSTVRINIGPDGEPIPTYLQAQVRSMNGTAHRPSSDRHVGSRMRGVSSHQALT